MSSHSLIYIRGLGHPNNKTQDKVVGWWRVFGFETHCFDVNWGDDEPFTQKLDRLTSLICDLAVTDSISLLGTSAGASAMLNAYALYPDKIHRAAYICGKVANIDTIKPDRRLRENPAFKESLNMLDNSLGRINTDNRRHILSVRPLYDGVVSVADTKLEGVREIIIPTIGHTASIATALTVVSPIIAGFLKENTIK